MTFDELKESISSEYSIEYKPHNSNRLMITFSANSRYFLYNDEMNANKLCVISNSPNYYLFNPGNICNLISKFIIENHFEKVILIGSSKAAIASLLWGHLINNKVSKQASVFSISFSPQTLLYPINDNFNYPSYQSFINKIETNDNMKICAEQYGNLSNILQDSTLNGLIVYGEDNVTDKTEADRINNSNIKKYPIQYSLHGSIFPFTLNTQDIDSVIKFVDKLYENSKKDRDLLKTLPKNKEDVIRIIMNINTPNLFELIQAIFFKMEKEQNEKYYTIVKSLMNIF